MFGRSSDLILPAGVTPIVLTPFTADEGIDTITLWGFLGLAVRSVTVTLGTPDLWRRVLHFRPHRTCIDDRARPFPCIGMLPGDCVGLRPQSRNHRFSIHDLGLRTGSLCRETVHGLIRCSGPVCCEFRDRTPRERHLVFLGPTACPSLWSSPGARRDCSSPGDLQSPSQEKYISNMKPQYTLNHDE